MATTSVKSVRIGRESTYNSLSNGTPSVSGVTLYPAICNDMGNVIQAGAPAMTDVSGRARNCIGAIPREPDTIFDGSGNPIEKRAGTFPLSLQVNGIGDASTLTDWDEIGWYNLLRTRLAESVLSSIATDIVATATSATAHTATDGAHFKLGQLFRKLKNNINDFAAVTNIATNALTYSPAMTVAAVAGDVCYPMRQVGFGCQPPDHETETVSCVVEMAGNGWKATAFGVTIDSVDFVFNTESGRLDANFVCESSFILWEKTTYTAITPNCPAGGVLHHLNAVLKISDSGGTSCSPVAAPAALAVTEYCLAEMSLTINFTNRVIKGGSNVTGRCGREIDNIEVVGSITLSSPTDDFDDVIWDKETRSILIGFTSGDSTDPGECGCFYIPAAVFTGDPAAYDSAETGYRTVLAFSSSGWVGDGGLDWQFAAAFGETY